MLLYVNGDELSGGACVVNDFVVAKDDRHRVTLGNRAHPENAVHSYGYYLSRLLNLSFVCEAGIRSSNDEIANEVDYFVNTKLPNLKSYYTVICIGWMPGVTDQLLNDVAKKINSAGAKQIFFNTKKPIAKTANLSFENYIDLRDNENCLITWCKNNGYVLKNNQYPDARAHNAWAKYIFGKMIKDQ